MDEELCPVTIASCTCGLPKDHESEAHVCSKPGCGGSWIGTGENDPNLQVLVWPGLPPGTSMEEALIITVVEALKEGPQ
ncbi:MAG: hypothetical protein ACJ780_31575 [Solirubrobacteraceae bacterium]|jgi:hypothetical protein